MKKKLLKPPAANREILLIPPAAKVPSLLDQGTRIGTAHQLSFFNPGVSLKFLFLEKLPGGRKEMVFVDTDRIKLEINLPSFTPHSAVRYVKVINTDEVLFEYPAPPREFWEKHLGVVENELEKLDPGRYPGIREPFMNFKTILFSHLDRKFLKEVLALTFREFYGLKHDFVFLSDLLRTETFRSFVKGIIEKQENFRRVFNQSLRDFKREFKFRYKNYPFPPLAEDELPFWRLKRGKRFPLYRDDREPANMPESVIFPRASTLTLFLRMHRYDIFIHGVGGGNYEWIQNRLLERFYNRSPRPYIVISGTFFPGDLPERDFPYFFYPPETVQRSLPDI